jgi:hypothetical protein
VAFRVGRGRWRYVAVAVVVAVAAAVAGTAAALSSGSAGPTAFGTFGGARSAPSRLAAAPLGLNVAPWDYIYAAGTSAGGGENVIQPLVKAAGIGQFRYGGGSYADYYSWQASRNIGKCLPGDATASFTASCASADPLGFGQFSRQARAVGAESFVTVNYGSGTPGEAAAWVAAAARTPGEGVALWEVGNETYGCWEVDNELAGPPANYRGYKPTAPGTTVNPTCPQAAEGDAAGTQTLATSYAVNARRFMKAMKAADPAALIGVPWAFGSLVPGGSVPDNSAWNNTVLGMDGKYAGFVDAHYYPFTFTGATGGANPTGQQVLGALADIPSLYGTIRAELDARDPGASVVVGETAVSNSATTTVCTPVGALFAAGDVLSWLAAGAQSVDWWDMNNYGNTTSNCAKPDYGLFTSASPPAVETPYYGYLLASVLARPHATLAAMDTNDPAAVLAFQSALPDDQHAMAFINTDTSSAHTVSFRPSAPLSGTLRTWSYGAGKQGVVTGTASAASVTGGITLPAESITVIETR